MLQDSPHDEIVRYATVNVVRPPVGVADQANGPVFHVEAKGRLANQMIQYMVALKFASLVPACRIANVNLRDWGICLPPIDTAGPSLVWTDAHRFDMAAVAQRILAGEIHRLHYEAYGHRVENFLDRTYYRDVFVAPRCQGVGYGSDHLLCHVRADDVLIGEHSGYVLTPIAFYQEIVARTGLRPVFIGETEPSLYVDNLRKAFPEAAVMPKGDIISDFETIRQSKNILVSCSSFCWLAAWLSDAEQIIMPVNGIFNPRQDSRIDLLPLGDTRYRFYLFPVNYAVPQAEYAAHHRGLTGMWREVSHGHLSRLLADSPRVPRRIEAFLPLFEERFYSSRYRAINKVLTYPHATSGLDHYRQHGFREGWQGFAFDEAWYTATYPMAAFEIAHGDYDNAIHHYAEVGRARGYRPTPPPHVRWATTLRRRLRRAWTRLAIG